MPAKTVRGPVKRKAFGKTYGEWARLGGSISWAYRPISSWPSTGRGSGLHDQPVWASLVHPFTLLRGDALRVCDPQRALFFPLIDRLVFAGGPFFPPDWTVEDKRQVVEDSMLEMCNVTAKLDGVNANRTVPTALVQTPTFPYQSGVDGGGGLFGLLPGDVDDPEALAGGFGL